MASTETHLRCKSCKMLIFANEPKYYIGPIILGKAVI